MNKHQAIQIVLKNRNNFIKSIRRKYYGDEYEDIFNSVVIKFMETWKGEKSDNPEAWFAFLLSRHIRNLIYQRSLDKRAKEEYLEIIEDTEDPSDMLDARQDLETILPLLNDLALESKAYSIFRDVVVEGMTYPEVAKKYSVTEGYCRVVVTHARAEFRDMMKSST